HAFGARRNTTNLSPTFSRDGATVVYAVSGENGSDLYAMPASGTGTPTRITVGRGSDNVQPSFSPEGRRIAFMSSRAGPPEIYISDADGTNPDMLTAYDFSTKNYRTSPDWSPDGRQVAYQSRVPDGSGGTFQIFTISLRDRTPRQLTSDAENEDPSWAPDGRHLVFTSTRSGEKQLWVLDVESGRMRQLTHAAGSRIAAWSPRLAPPAAPAP
ncbi:MAG TPA: hypothetical protein VG818_05350, partial [Gemmatimonadaceae bacterium]|nr:hypothetical protein [Gemmatimonadaceae bacterium]